MIRYTRLDSPLGALLVARDEQGITDLWMPSGRHRRDAKPGWERDDAGFEDLRTELEQYFAGTRTEFEVALHAAGTAFQKRVWGALVEIPYGCTASYGQTAAAIGAPASASRAVGTANGSNPISIVVPCHRVIGANGSLVGYGGGLDAKRWLLAHEATYAPVGLFAP